jgi:hypothetical protein
MTRQLALTVAHALVRRLLYGPQYNSYATSLARTGRTLAANRRLARSRLI